MCFALCDLRIFKVFHYCLSTFQLTSSDREKATLSKIKLCSYGLKSLLNNSFNNITHFILELNDSSYRGGKMLHSHIPIITIKKRANIFKCQIDRPRVISFWVYKPKKLE